MEEVLYEMKPGNGNACGQPNPPWWCDDAPAASIDIYTGLVLILALIFGIITTKITHK